MTNGTHRYYEVTWDHDLDGHVHQHTERVALSTRTIEEHVAAMHLLPGEGNVTWTERTFAEMYS